MSTASTVGSSPIDKLVATAVNGAEVLRYGGFRTEHDPAPYDVVSREPVFRLRHYFPDDGAGREPVLLVPPLMQVAEVWDISPATSAVRILNAEGIDPWVVDFGDPATEAGGAGRSFSDHVLAVADAIGKVKAATGKDVHIGGYSQGGIFCYVAAAYLACRDVCSIFTLGSPIGQFELDTYLPEKLVWEAARLQGKVLRHTGIPRWAVQRMFNWANPQRNVQSDLEFLLALYDRESLMPREPQRKFLKRGAWIGWSGPAIEELIEVASENRLIEGGVVIGDRTVGLADVTCPVLIVIGEADQFGPAHQVRQIVRAAPKAEVYECVLPVGHFGLPVSSHARAKTWPGAAAFAQWAAGRGALPDYLAPLTEDSVTESAAPVRRPLASLSYGAGLAAGTLLAAPGVAARSTRRTADLVRELSTDAVAQLPRLLTLERLGPSTRVSYGSLLAAAARSRSDDIAFVFGGRAHSYAESDRRTTNVVRGLLSVGVRRGERVGVLTGMRPSALITVAALNRIGAVAVLLRPGQDVRQEARLGQVTKVISDAEHAEVAAEIGTELFVLGGGPSRPPLPAGAVDLETVDPDSVIIPKWYRPNPGLARDVAYILFSGVGDGLRADRITNGRWATSAYAAASASSLTSRDTVYSMSPLHHPSGLLLATAASLASGARLAMGARFDPDTFWAEVRRYGATVVPYTWTMLHALVEADPHPEERNHPIRLFMGSGMPAGLWRRVEDRFGPAVVLELYASTRSDAILGNVSGRKIGSFGKPLPGTPAVRVVRCDDDGAVAIGPDGYAVPASRDEPGLLLVDARHGGAATNDTPLRGVFAADDSWLSTGDVFRADRDGDLWLVDAQSALIHTARGVVSPRTVETALSGVDTVDLAAAYPIAGARVGGALAVVAVTVRPGKTLDVDAVNQALQAFEVGQRPDIVHVVDELPMTSWFRPSVAELQRAGRPAAGPTVFRLDRRRRRYVG